MGRKLLKSTLPDYKISFFVKEYYKKSMSFLGLLLAGC